MKLLEEPRIIVTGIVLLLTLGSGVWVAISGRPINILISTLHKLIAIAAVILTATTIYYLRKPAEMAPPEIGAVVLVAALFVSLFASGALLLQEKPAAALIQLLHRVAPILAAVGSLATIYFLARGK